MSTPPHGQPILAVTRHYPALAPPVEAAARGDWPATLNLMAALEPGLQYLAAWEIGEALDDDAVAALQKVDGTGVGLPKLLAAVGLVALGWKIRSDKRAKQVSSEQFTSFHDYLRRAERLLIEVTAHEPGNAVGWTLRLTTARGLQLGPNEARRRYGHAAAASAHFPFAQGQLLQQLCPKWSGTWDEVHAFARECAFAAPPGSVNGAMVVEGHLERWADLRGGDAGAAHLRQPAVQQEVTQAAVHSVLHPSFRPGAVGWIWAHNAFAWYWSLVGNTAAAATHFRQLGDYAHKDFWEYLGEPAVVFQKHRIQMVKEA